MLAVEVNAYVRGLTIAPSIAQTTPDLYLIGNGVWVASTAETSVSLLRDDRLAPGKVAICAAIPSFAQFAHRTLGERG